MVPISEIWRNEFMPQDKGGREPESPEYEHMEDVFFLYNVALELNLRHLGPVTIPEAHASSDSSYDLGYVIPSTSNPSKFKGRTLRESKPHVHELAMDFQKDKLVRKNSLHIPTNASIPSSKRKLKKRAKHFHKQRRIKRDFGTIWDFGND